ncbi:MAG: tonB [Ramlibacter sp.]|nr:tonB [Ramlibacter sp.]
MQRLAAGRLPASRNSGRASLRSRAGCAPPAFYTSGLPAPAYSSVRQSHRYIVIGGSVVLFHAAALWALQSGLLRRTVEIIVPVEILSELVTPPQPKNEPTPAPPPEPPPRVKPQTVKKVERVPPPAPQPLAIRDAPPAPNAPTGVTAPQPPAPPIAAPVAPAPSPPAAAPAPARIELPTSDADYLQNPKPPYPAISKRLGEQGKVVVRVFIGVDGLPQQAEVRQSSGFERLDQAAKATAMKWRYVPGKRGGVPEAMWVNVPINFVLE